MLGRTAGGLTWMNRYIERAENTARLVETGLRMSLTRRDDAPSEWAAVVTSSGVSGSFEARHGPSYDADHVVDFLLRDPDNPSSAISAVRAARENARGVRTALTREVWEAVNECWLDMSKALARPIDETDLPDLLDRLRRHGSLVRGALIGTMLRNAAFHFSRLGVALERADNTARILDVKYHVLLPKAADVGGPLDTAQWEQLLYAVHVRRAYLTEHGAEFTADRVAEFLILNPRMPRSLVFCAAFAADRIRALANEFGDRPAILDRAEALEARLRDYSVDDLFRIGLHEVVTGVIDEVSGLSDDLASTYRFTA